MDNDAKLIADLYYDSGLSKDTFNKIYISTLKKYLSKFKNDNSILESIKIAMRKRRSIYLPNGVFAEDIHSNKDVWTFVVFLSGLIIAAKTDDVESILSKVLDSDIRNWLKEKNTEKTVFSICDSDSKDLNVEIIRGFYGLHSEKVIVVEGVHGEKELDDSISNDLTPLVVEQVGKLTNKEVGKLFIEWALGYAENKNELVQVEDQCYLVKSPSAFIKFSKIDKHSWKSVQKGVFKLNLHELNEENGTPFHNIKGANVMKFDKRIKDYISNH
jgi:hypothetical protein